MKLYETKQSPFTFVYFTRKHCANSFEIIITCILQLLQLPLESCIFISLESKVNERRNEIFLPYTSGFISDIQEHQKIDNSKLTPTYRFFFIFFFKKKKTDPYLGSQDPSIKIHINIFKSSVYDAPDSISI